MNTRKSKKVKKTKLKIELSAHIRRDEDNKITFNPIYIQMMPKTE